jgi:hypothetical protein
MRQLDVIEHALAIDSGLIAYEEALVFQQISRGNSFPLTAEDIPRKNVAGHVSTSLKERIAAALSNGECDVKSLEARGYTKQELSRWKSKLQKSGPNSFRQRGRPRTFDDIAIDEGKEEVQKAFVGDGECLPSGLGRQEAHELVVNAARRTIERRTGGHSVVR